MAKTTMKERAARFLQRGWAELAAAGRFGLVDAQNRFMGEFAGPTPNSPGMAGTPTQQQVTEQFEQADETPPPSYEEYRQAMTGNGEAKPEVEQPKVSKAVEKDHGPEVG